jgi:kynurenine formamidase
MKLVDLTHRFSIHTPGWVGYPSPKLSYFQRHATNGIVSQWLELPLHSGTHFDGLCREGVIVDISDEMEDWAVIKPEHISDRAEVRKGDILIYHTGYHRYFNGGAEEDEERYFLRHPGGDRQFAEWLVEMEFAWTGFDTGSADHPMNTSIRFKRPDAARRFERETGQTLEQRFPEDDIFVMHRVPFPRGILHVENMGGDIEQALGKRCLIGAFPIPIEGGEASPCRVVAFIED